MVQVIRRTPQAPVRNKGQQFAEAFSNLAQTGTQHLYAQAEKAKKSNALKQYLGKGYEDLDFSNLDDDTIKEIVKQEAKSKARQNYFGGNDPLAQPQPGTFGEQFQNAPVDVQIGATPASENAGETEGQKIKRLENELENFQYEDEDDHEKPKISKPKLIPMPGPFKPPHSQEQIKKSLGWNIQEGRALQQENADARRAYDAEVKRIQQDNQHAENQVLKQSNIALKEKKLSADLTHRQEEDFKKSYDKDRPFIEDTTQAYKAWMTSEKPRLMQLRSIDPEKLISATGAVFMETLGIPLGALDDPSSELFEKVSLDMLKGLPETYGNKIMKVEVENYLKTIPSLMNSPDGKRMIISNFLKLGEMKEVYYDAMRNQQTAILDNPNVTPTISKSDKELTSVDCK